jgi:DNA-binding transcriptional ArsR family regulator
MTHPTQDLNEIVHQRTRLGVLAVLAEADRVAFGFLQQALGLTDGNLSGHLRTLESAGYILIEKTYEGRKPRTWIRMTRSGSQALADELTALKQLVSRLESPPGDDATTDHDARPEATP